MHNVSGSTASPATQGAQVVVGVADLAVSDDPAARVVTFALGSCIGITAYDPVAKVGGLLHFMLPKPPDSGDSETIKPYMYATKAIPMLLDQLQQKGAQLERIVLCAAGAAEVMDDGGFFAIGQRNRTMMRKVFWRQNLKLAAEDTGGNAARTMSLRISDGQVTVKSVAEERVLWTP